MTTNLHGAVLAVLLSALSAGAAGPRPNILVMQKTAAPALYDLAGDIAESADLSGRNASRRDTLKTAYDAWAATLPEPLWEPEKEPRARPRATKLNPSGT